MLKTEKEEIVAELVERLREADTLIVADYRGLTHAELNGVRTELLGHGARFTVCKNTLTRRAASEAGAEGLLEFLTGPTAIAFVHDGDMVAVAKTLAETARTTRRLELKGAVLQGRRIDADSVRELATLPPVDVLRGEVLGAIIAPLTSLLGLVSAPLTNLVGLIDARIDQIGGDADAAAQAEAPEPEAVAEVEAAAEADATESADDAPPPDDAAPPDDVPADEEATEDTTTDEPTTEGEE